MKLSKRQKVCIAVLGLALCGLVIDRTLLQDGGATGPDQAAAAGTGAESAASLPPAAAVRLETAPPASSTESPVAKRLATLAATRRLDPAQAKDAFKLRKTWKLKVIPEDAPDPRDIRAEKFVKEHTLEAVMVSGRLGSAAVNGQWVSVGEQLDGFQLIAVTQGSRDTPGSATFEFEERRVVLRLPGKK